MTPEGLLYDRMTTRDNVKGQTVIDLRAAIALLFRQHGKRCRDVENSKRRCGGTDTISMGDRFRRQFLKHGKLD